MARFFWVLALTATLSVSIGSALECYQCAETWTGGAPVNCGLDPFLPSANGIKIVTCDIFSTLSSNCVVSRKEVTREHNQVTTTVVRGCGSALELGQTGCTYGTDSAKSPVSICPCTGNLANLTTGDLCNTATTSAVPPATAGSVLLSPPKFIGVVVFLALALLF